LKFEVWSLKSEVRSLKCRIKTHTEGPLTSEALKLLFSRMSHYACWPTRCTAEWPFCYWSLFSVSEVWSPKSEVRNLKSQLHGFRNMTLISKRKRCIIIKHNFRSFKIL
jgi:hypothetical protein